MTTEPARQYPDHVDVEYPTLTSQQLAVARSNSAARGSRLPQTLSHLGLLADADIAQSLARATGAPIVPRDRLQLHPSLLERLNPAWLSRYSAIPLGYDGEKLSLALADPTDSDRIAALEFATGATASDLSIATFGDMADLLSGLTAQPDADPATAFDLPQPSDDLDRISDATSEAPVIRLVHRLLTEAVNRRASDVHIEPMARHVTVRYRIDGRLIEVEQLPEALALPIASRIKIMAGLDIAESRLPQDGRLRLTVRGRDVDVRVATSPIAHGESIVLRLLGRSEVPLDLAGLGIAPDNLEHLHSLLDRPHGMILVTGPTGSGKTTTLYAALDRLRRPEVKILTVEDPVEVVMEGVNQVQVRPEIDLDYAATLRAFLRQDPDILMIGEIRDRDTADIAMRAALTGHLVLSTLHTNSALGAFTRLRDIGIEPFLTASTVIATLAQRLVRKLCAHCAAPRALSASEHDLFARHSTATPAEVRDPVGCAHCGGTGWRGRHLVIELVEVDEPLRAAIRDDRVEALDRLPDAASLAGHGLALVAAGTTSLDEVRRVIDMP